MFISHCKITNIIKVFHKNATELLNRIFKSISAISNNLFTIEIF